MNSDQKQTSALDILADKTEKSLILTAYLLFAQTFSDEEKRNSDVVH